MFKPLNIIENVTNRVRQLLNQLDRVTNLNENGFKRFLESRRLLPTTIEHYIISVNMFNEWLVKEQGKRLKNANESDIKLWTPHIQKKKQKRVKSYFYGLKMYYIFKANYDMVKTIDEIKSKLPSPPKSKLKSSIGWTDFRNEMSKIEKTSISYRNRALLELLWSEMHYNEILSLRGSDINFEKRLITSRIRKKTYHVTQEAWDALKEHIPSKDRVNRKLLFPIKPSRFWQITKQYFSGNLSPKKIMEYVREDLISAGKQTRFQQLDKLERWGIELGDVKNAEKKDALVDTDLFEQEILSKARKMADFYVLYYSLENSVRKLITDVLSEKYDIDWWEQKIPSGIKQNVQKLQGEEKITAMSIRSEDNLSYVNFGELIDIFNQNWNDFADILRSKKAVQDTLSKFSKVRNVIAHSCELNDDEILRFKLLIKDWLRIQQE